MSHDIQYFVSIGHYWQCREHILLSTYHIYRLRFPEVTLSRDGEKQRKSDDCPCQVRRHLLLQNVIPPGSYSSFPLKLTTDRSWAQVAEGERGRGGRDVCQDESKATLLGKRVWQCSDVRDVQTAGIVRLSGANKSYHFQSLTGHQRHFEECDRNPECRSRRVPNPRLEWSHQQVAEGEEALGEQVEGVGGQELLVKGGKNAGQVTIP